MSKYTQKTLEYLTKQGYEAGVVEKWIMGANKRRDLFGVIDIVAMGHGMILGVQSSSYAGRKSHMEKILAEPRVRKWLVNGGHLLLITWKKVLRKRGGKAFRYEPVIDDITLDLLPLENVAYGCVSDAADTENSSNLV
jgi:hypothetical protein